jgi:hypothetical protein
MRRACLVKNNVKGFFCIVFKTGDVMWLNNEALGELTQSTPFVQRS